MAKTEEKQNCGHCREWGHSIRTCNNMKVVSMQRTKEVMSRYKESEGRMK